MRKLHTCTFVEERICVAVSGEDTRQRGFVTFNGGNTLRRDLAGSPVTCGRTDCREAVAAAVLYRERHNGKLPDMEWIISTLDDLR